MIWDKSFILVFKYSFFNHWNLCQSFHDKRFCLQFLSASSVLRQLSAGRLHEPCSFSDFSVKKRYLSVDLSAKSFPLWRWDCWSVYARFHKVESSKLSIQWQNTLSFNGVPNCKMFVSAQSRLKATHVCCIRVFKIKKTILRSVSSC